MGVIAWRRRRFFYNRHFTLLEQLLIGDLARTRLDLAHNAFASAILVLPMLAGKIDEKLSGAQ